MKEILITSSVLIFVLLALRWVFAKRVSRVLIYGAWALVALRLLIPVQIGKIDFSILTSAKTVTEAITQIEQRPVSGQTKEEVYEDIVADYIEKDQTVFIPEVQEQIRQEISLGTVSREEILDKIQQARSDQEIFIPEVQAQVQQQVEQTADPITLGQIATVVWLVGVGAMTVWFVVVNLRHSRILRRNREKLACDSSIAVYVSEKVSSPCLMGLLRPVVYLTPASAAKEETCRHVLTHELTHYRHGDHIWSLVRCLCLCVYWFNPLVWVAAWCSRRDCELACDEGALKRLGSYERIAYGKSLLEVVSYASAPAHLMQTATAMNETKKQLKERVEFIVRKQKRSLVAAVSMVLVCVVVSGCAMSGPSAKEAERSIEVNYQLEKEIYQRGESLRITITVKNTGCEIPYVGSEEDQFVPIKLSADEYEISSIDTDMGTCDATNRVFRYGETMSDTYVVDIPYNAVCGVYDVQFRIFGVDVLLDRVVAIEGEFAAGFTPQNPEDLLATIPEEEQRQIKHAFLTQFYSKYSEEPEIIENTSLRVFGVFDDTYVLFVDGALNYADAFFRGEFGLVYPSSQEMYIYRDGRFYSEWKYAEMLTDEEVSQVVCNYYNAYPSLKALYGSTELVKIAFG